jgi:hypothetical protein
MEQVAPPPARPYLTRAGIARVRRAYDFQPVEDILAASRTVDVRVALLGCTAQKLDRRAPAAFLYSRSPLFRKALEYAARTCDAALVLSAQHRVLELAAEVAPYELALDDVTGADYAAWSDAVALQLRSLFPPPWRVEFVVLCGERYVRQVRRQLVCGWTEPLVRQGQGKRVGMGIGERSAWLDEQLHNRLPPRHVHTSAACLTDGGSFRCGLPESSTWGRP